jgi:hypothetical protein
MQLFRAFEQFHHNQNLADPSAPLVPVLHSCYLHQKVLHPTLLLENGFLVGKHFQSNLLFDLNASF